MEEFEIKDLGELKCFLGIEVARSKKGILISQQKYTLDLLEEIGKLGAKPVDTPMEQIMIFILKVVSCCIIHVHIIDWLEN